ncbi:MAG: radical SAM protein [Candidatus Pacearchaeota archaeon]|nr:radical SAM protein [Candidatus Pacearchaeota archaeon]
MKRVCLINPPSPDFLDFKEKIVPISLIYLGSVLKENNVEIRILDINNDLITLGKTNNLSVEEYLNHFTEDLEKFDPDLIGITVLFSGRFKKAIKITQKLKKDLTKDVPIIFGGIHPTIFPKEILENYPEVDYVCIGEGETTLLDLVNGRNPEKIDGLASRLNGKIHVNPKTRFIEDLDSLPLLDYGLINLKDYYFDTSKWDNPKNLSLNNPVPILTSRSCPQNCTFCSMHLVHGRGWRARSAKNVADELETLVKEYDHHFFTFIDDNMTLNKKRTIEICDGIIKRKLDIQFTTVNGLAIKSLDREVTEKLIEAGLIRLYVAPEHGSPYIRNNCMGKNLSQETIYKFFDMIKDYKDLYVRAFFVVGYPQETKETFKETEDMIVRIRDSLDDVALFNAVPYPGTKLFDYCKEKNLLLIPTENLQDMENFSNYNYSDNAFIKPTNMTIEELQEFRNRCMSLVKRRPKSYDKTFS